jgi:hypothetical protein
MSGRQALLGSPTLSAGRGTTARRLRRDIGVVIWLKGRDLAGMTGRPGLARAGMAGYVLAVAALLGGAAFLHGVAPLSVSRFGSTLAPLWLLWALLPAIGGGGGAVESAATLAPYPVRPQVHLLSSWLSAALDLQYLAVVPVLAAALAATYGPAALVPAFGFVLGASAVGQLLAWALGGGLRPARGVGLSGTALVVVVLAALFLVRGRDALSGLGVWPTGWLQAACRAGAARSWGPWLVWSLVCAGPALVLVGLGTPLVRRALLARAVGAASGSSCGRAPGRGLPRWPGAALVAAAIRGVLRSVAFRVAALMALAIPFVAAAVFPGVSVTALASMALISGGSSVAANAWAFDEGGVVVWLSAPVSVVRLVLLRAAVVVACLGFLLGAVTAGALAARLPLAGWGTAGFALLLLLVVTAVGLRTATKYPAAADLDSLRGRPTAPWAVLTYTVRAGVGAAVLAGAWTVPDVGPVLACAGVGLYCLWALRAVVRSLGNPAPLLAAFAGIR